MSKKSDVQNYYYFSRSCMIIEYSQKKRKMFPVKHRHKISTIGLQKKKQYLANKEKPVKYKNENRKGWGSQGKPWLDRKNPKTNKRRLGILDECNWNISYTSLYREEQLVLLP